MLNVSSPLFYVFSTILLGSAVMVVTSRKTVHGVLFLILSFLNAAGLFILLQAEFLAMILVIVYVGAVAVLFLFIVMMLNGERQSSPERNKPYTLMAYFVGGLFTGELILMILLWYTSPEAFVLTGAPFASYKGMSNTQILGNVLYTHYALPFQGIGLILLIAMVGAIVLTLRRREGAKKQNVGEQIKRKSRESVRLVDIPRGLGN